MRKDKEVVSQQDNENNRALALKRTQDKIRSKFEFLSKVEPKYFQAEYVKTQAQEICNYLKYLGLTPLRAWYSKQLETISDPVFMYDFFLTKNEFGTIVPDIERIEKLILPDPLEDPSPTIERTFISE